MQLGGYSAQEHMVATPLLFGCDPFILTATLAAIAYLLIMSEHINRAIVTMVAAGILIIFGVLNQHQAIAAIEFCTLGLIIGMMMIVHVTGKTGVFQYLAIWSIKQVNAQPWGLMLMLSVVAALGAAIFEHIATIVLIVPILLRICKELELDPYPYLFACIFAANMGAATTYIDDHSTILIGSAMELHLLDIMMHIAPAIIIIFGATMISIYAIWGKKITASPEKRAKVMALNERESITDARLLKDCLYVGVLVLLGFTLAHTLGFELATIAITGAALLLLLENLRHDPEHHFHNVHTTFAEVEWVTIFFLVGLFIIAGGVQHVGLLDVITQTLLEPAQDSLQELTYAILWGTAYLSAFIDNAPLTTTMAPMIESLAISHDHPEAIMPLIWALLLGTCLGANGTLIGASANIVVAGLAQRDDQPIHFMKFLIMALPLMTLSIIVSHVYLYVRYFSNLV